MNQQQMQQQQSGNENYNMSGVFNDNRYFNDANSLTIRLNTEPILIEVEAKLRGQRLYEEYKGDQVITKAVKIGQPLANEKGIQAIMFFLQSIFNSHVVQANFKEDVDYELYMVRRRKDFACILIDNKTDFDITLSHMKVVISSVMAAIEAFMTRPIDNKERDSLTSSTKMVESVQTGTQQKKILGVF